MDKYIEILLIIFAFTGILFAIKQTLLYLIARQEKIRKIEEFDKICENTLSIIRENMKTWNKLRSIFVEFEYFMHKDYQQNIRQNTDFE